MNEILDQLEINQTFFYQFALFGVFFLIVSQLYLKPFQRLIEKRNQKLKDDVESSAELLKTIEGRVKEYETALAQTRAEAIRHYESSLNEVREGEERVLNQLKDELKKEYVRASQELQDERLKIESELKLQLAPVSDAVVQKILAGN
jgi:F-type H+-transporting ATPase subunit b